MYVCAPNAQREKEKRPKRRRKLLHDMSDISSVGFQAHGSLDEYRFNMFMRDLLTEKAKDIYRCKGVLAVHVSGPWGQRRWGGWLLAELARRWPGRGHMWGWLGPGVRVVQRGGCPLRPLLTCPLPFSPCKMINF